MSAFTLHVITAVCFGLSAPLAALQALEHWLFRELLKAMSWSVLAITFAVLAVMYSVKALGA